MGSRPRRRSASSNYTRLDFVTYPNGRTLYARYTHSSAASTQQDEIAAAFRRIGQWAQTDDADDRYAEFTYAGLSTAVTRAAAHSALGNDTALNYDFGTTDQYAGLDLFGRVINQRITEADSKAERDDVEYRANRDGSPQFAQPQAAPVLGRSSLYGYDGLHRLTSADVGLLNSGRTDLLAEWADPHARAYTMDILGNITALDRRNSGTSASESRSYNATNELTSRTVAAEAPRYWVRDDFTDNDTDAWIVPDLNDGGGDGTWAAASGALSCTGTISITGAPDGGTGTMLLIDDPYYQDVRLACAVTLNSGGDNAGLVFAYLDRLNYWVKVYSNAQDKVLIYQVSDGTWTQKSSSNYTISNGTPFTMTAEVRAGAADSYAASLAAGQVGLWCSDSSDNSFDDFQVRDIAGPFEVDGKWFGNAGDVRVDHSNSNLLEAYGTGGLEDVIVRRGFRGEKYVATFKFTWNGTTSPGWVVRWLSPGDYLALAISASDSETRLYKREADGTLTTVATADSGLSLSTSTEYEARVIVGDDPGDGDLQQLTFTVDTDRDGDYSDETPQITTTAVDDVWSAGLVGLYRAAGGSAAQSFNDVKVWLDHDEDGILDAADDVQVADSFDSGTISLSYDNNGNLTGDGLLRYVYDAWNRLVKANRSADGDTTTIATYAYDGQNRRTEKVVSNSGPEAVPGDGGNTTVHFYYGGVPGASGGVTRWNVFETRNGSNNATRQWVWGTRYVDELILMDVNGSAYGNDNDCDPDVGGLEAGLDRRYFYHQDRNWNVVALTEYEDGPGTAGQIAERYAYTPYGEFVVLTGAGTAERGQVKPYSTVGNPFAHQGLGFDGEKLSYQNRWREYMARLERFAKADTTGVLDGYRSPRVRMHHVDGASLYVDRRSNPTVWSDWDGRCVRGTTRTVGIWTERCGLFGARSCTTCQYCACGDNYPNIGNLWTSYDVSCTPCTCDGSGPYSPCPPPNLMPLGCCAYHNNPNLQTCIDCCEGLFYIPNPPPYWQIPVGECLGYCRREYM